MNCEFIVSVQKSECIIHTKNLRTSVRRHVGLTIAVFLQDKSFAVLPSQTVYTRLSSYINVF